MTERNKRVRRESATPAAVSHFPSESATLAWRVALGRRIATARESLGLTQPALARHVGGSMRGLQNNERGVAIPSSVVLLALMRLGVSPSWLLDERGPMMLADLEKRSIPPINSDALGQIIAGVEAWILRRARKIAPDKKAQVVTLIYEHWATHGNLDERTMERYLKLVA